MNRCPRYGLYIINLINGVLFFCSLTALAAQVGVKAQWSEGSFDGWRLLNLESGQYVADGLSVVDGALEWRYLSGDSGDKYRVSANVEASNGAFVGNYFDGGVAMLDLELYAEVATGMTVELWHATDLLYYTAELGVEAGWQRIQIPVNTDFFSAGFGSSDNLEAWIENIGEVLIGTSRGSGEGEQIYRLRNVVLRGSAQGYANWMQTYINRHGGSFAEWMPGADYSGDGDANSVSHITGNDPADPTDKLMMRLSFSPLAVHWNSKLGRLYSVWHSSFNDDGFVKVSESGIAGTGSEISFTIGDDPSHQASVYKIKVKLDR